MNTRENISELNENSMTVSQRKTCKRTSGLKNHFLPSIYRFSRNQPPIGQGQKVYMLAPFEPYEGI